MVSKDKFARALESYVTTNLRNNVGFDAFEGFDTDDGAIVNFKVNRKDILLVTKAETYEHDVSVLKGKLKDAETELKEAKKTINELEAKIEKTTQENEAIPQETEEIAEMPKAVRRRKA